MERLKKLITGIKGFEGPLKKLDDLQIDEIVYDLQIKREKILLEIRITPKWDTTKYSFYKILSYSPIIFKYIKNWRIWELGITTDNIRENIKFEDIEKMIFDFTFTLDINENTKFEKELVDFLRKIGIVKEKVKINYRENYENEDIEIKLIETFNYPILIKYKNLEVEFLTSFTKTVKFDKIIEIRNTFKLNEIENIIKYLSSDVNVEDVKKYIK
jgi:hypothetical protein